MSTLTTFCVSYSAYMQIASAVKFISSSNLTITYSVPQPMGEDRGPGPPWKWR